MCSLGLFIDKQAWKQKSAFFNLSKGNIYLKSSPGHFLVLQQLKVLLGRTGRILVLLLNLQAAIFEELIK